MMYRFFIACVFTSLLFQWNSVQAQKKYVNEFLNIGVGARSHGMFQAQVASVNDVTAAIWNPAGLSALDAPLQISAMRAAWFGGIANYDYIGVAKKLNEEKQSVISLSIIRMGIDNIPNTLNLIGPDGSVQYDKVQSFSATDYALFGSYSRKFYQHLRFGASVKVINRSIGTFANAWGFGMDAGLMYTRERYTFGLMARDISTTYNSWAFNLSEKDKAVFAKTGNSIPVSSTETTLPRLILGFALHSNRSDYTSKFSYLIEANVNVNTDGRASGLIQNKNIAIEPTLGLELGLYNRVFIRGGVGNMQRLINDYNTRSRSFNFTPAMGLGLKLGRFKIDYALNNIGSNTVKIGNSVSHIVSLSLDFAPRKREKQE